MDPVISRERDKDYKTTERLIEKAFKEAEYSDHKEHVLVEKLRQSDDFLPELSLVAEFNGKIIGHIMFTRLIIDDGKKKHKSLALAPLSVLPQYQNKGVGSKLIIEGIRIARELGHRSVIVLGNNSFYQNFGFRPASNWAIKAPFQVEDRFFMALELVDNGLKGTSGTVIYNKEFL